MGILSKITGFLFGWLIPDAPQPELGTEVTKAATDASIPVLYGRGYGSGVIVFQASNDADNDDIKNDLLHQIVIWGEGQCGGIVKNYVNDDLSTISKYNAKSGRRWYYAANFNNGLATYSDALLSQSGKRTTDKFDGKLVSYIRCEMAKDIWAGSPSHMAEWTGRVISTPSGGTATASENPVSQLYDLLKSPIYGKGLTTAEIDVASFQSERPYCDTLIETYPASGIFRKLFTSNVSLDTSNSVLDNVNTLLKAMRGLLPVSNGKLKLIIEKDDPAVDFVLDENDKGFIEWGTITDSSKSNRYNRVIVSWTDPDAGWTKQEAIYPPTGSALETTLLDDDNGIVLEKSVDLKTCIYYHEAMHHAKTLLEVSRDQLRTTVEWGPEAIILEVGDILPAVRKSVGWTNKLFRIETTEESSSGTVTLKLREHQPYIYDDANTGDKPSLPDTELAFVKPATPTTAVIADVYNDFAQVELSWTSTTTRHQIVITDSSGNLIVSTPIGRKNYSITNYPLGTYTVEVYAIGGLDRQSEALGFTFDITAPPTPLTAPVVTSKPGFITVEPPTPSSSVYTYEWRWSTSADATIIAGGRDTTKTITPVIADVTYTIEYRLITETGEGEWLSVDVNGIERTVYTWVVYADDDAGTGISLSPVGKSFYGIATGMQAATISLANPAIFDYYPEPAGGGTPTINAYLSNDPHIVSTAADGSGGTYPVSTTLSVLIGVVDDTAAYTIGASAAAGISGSLSGSTYTVTNLTADTATVTFTATRADYPTMIKVFSISKVKAGADGDTGPQGVPGTSGTSGTTTYTWIRYGTASSGGTSSNDPTGKTYIGFAYNKTTATESTNNADYTWSLIQGPQGNTGVAGAPGVDGTPRYTWIKYASNSTGTTGFTDTPDSGTTHIGIAPNKTSASESNTPGDYTWSLLKGDAGPQGVAGAPGADGTPRYTWIRYGTASNGGTSSNDPTGKTYIGFAYNKTTATESTNNADYTWSLIQGVQGNTGVAGAPGADGTPRYTWIKYASTSDGYNNFVDIPNTTTKYIGIAPNKTTATESGDANAYTWSLLKGDTGATGGQGGQGPIGPPGPEGPIATARSYAGSDAFAVEPDGDWLTLVSIAVPAGTWKFDMEITARAQNIISLTLYSRWTRNGVELTGQSASMTSKFPNVNSSYHAIATISAYTYALQVKLSGAADSSSASGYLTVVEQL
jgi:hypothetical protein